MPDAQAASVWRESYYALVLVTIMVCSGGLGGLVNHYIRRTDDGQPSALKESLVTGLAAAFLVPLFLQMISSELIGTGRTEHLKLFVFAGFCLVAAISSKAFVQTISEKVLKEARQAKSSAEQARETAQSAIGAALSAGNKAEYAVVAATPEPQQTAAFKASGPEEHLAALCNRYNEIRATMKKGPTRTTEMTKIVRHMIELAPQLKNFPLIDYLREPSDRGKRLAAYAYLYAQPDGKILGELVNSVTKTDNRAFGEYWGIQAIGKVIGSQDKSSTPPELLKALRSFHDALPRGSDRQFELSRILT